MKSQLLTAIITVFAIVFIPISCLSIEKPSKNNLSVSANVQGTKADKVSFKLYRTESGEIEKITATDYLCGVLAAEMPVSFEKEALKAQAVAAYTFALYKSEHSTEDYDITDDYKTDQSYIPLDKAQEKWGDKSSEYTEIVKSAVAAVNGMYLTYEGEIALTVYHAVSSGKTFSCKEVWGKDIPYLVSVDSNFDKTSSSYISTVSISKKELQEKLNNIENLENSKDENLGEIQKSSSGRVETVDLCGKKITGSALREALSLKSSSFDITYENDSFTFTVYGYGHGVGMSQNGANELAKQGSTFEEILSHYYKGTKIKT